MILLVLGVLFIYSAVHDFKKGKNTHNMVELLILGVALTALGLLS